MSDLRMVVEQPNVRVLCSPYIYVCTHFDGATTAFAPLVYRELHYLRYIYIPGGTVCLYSRWYLL